MWHWSKAWDKSMLLLSGGGKKPNNQLCRLSLKFAVNWLQAFNNNCQLLKWVAVVRTTNTVQWKIEYRYDSNSAMCALQIWFIYKFVHCNNRKIFELYLPVDCITSCKWVHNQCDWSFAVSTNLKSVFNWKLNAANGDEMNRLIDWLTTASMTID